MEEGGGCSQEGLRGLLPFRGRGEWDRAPPKSVIQSGLFWREGRSTTGNGSLRMPILPIYSENCIGVEVITQTEGAAPGEGKNKLSIHALLYFV